MPIGCLGIHGVGACAGGHGLWAHDFGDIIDQINRLNLGADELVDRARFERGLLGRDLADGVRRIGSAGWLDGCWLGDRAEWLDGLDKGRSARATGSGGLGIGAERLVDWEGAPSGLGRVDSIHRLLTRLPGSGLEDPSPETTGTRRTPHPSIHGHDPLCRGCIVPEVSSAITHCLSDNFVGRCNFLQRVLGAVRFCAAKLDL